MPAHPVTGAVTDHRHAGAPQIGDDELSLVRWLVALRIDDLEDELVFVEMQPVLLGALEAPGADFGGAGVVEAARSPGLLDARLGGGQTGAGLTGVDGDMHRCFPH